MRFASLVMMLAVACGGSGGAGPDTAVDTDVHGVTVDYIETAKDSAMETATVDQRTEAVPEEAQEAVGEDVTLEALPEEVEAAVEIATDEVGGEEAAADQAGLDEASGPECAAPAECEGKHGPAGLCRVWSCDDGKCVKAFAAPLTPCDDKDLCTSGDACDASGSCVGAPVDCDDKDGCTTDSCDPAVGCKHDKLLPKECVDEAGNPGVQVCVNGAYGPCEAPKPCNLKVNSNDTGTVNPFIWPARNGLFYVSYVASEDGGGNLKLAWVDPKTCSIAAGPFTVNDKPGNVYYWGAQAVVSDPSGNFYAVWETKEPSSNVAFAASETGEAFLPAVTIVSTSENGLYPAIAVMAPGKVAISWTGYIKADNPSGFAYDPFVTTNLGVFSGAPFSTAVQVASTPIQDDSTAIAVDPSGNIYVAWESFQDGTAEGGNIYVAKSTDGGKTFGPPVRVNDVPGKASVGVGNFLAWGKDRLYVVFSDSRTDSEGDVYLDSSSDGLDFGTDVMVNDNIYRSQEDPSVAVGRGSQCAGHVYVVWQDLRSNKSYDIYGAKSTDGGKTFAANVRLNPEEAGDQMNPSLTVDYSCIAGVTWRDSSANEKFDVRTTFKAGW